MRPIEYEITRRILTQIGQYFKNKNYNINAEVVDGSIIEREEGIDAVVIIGDKVWGFQTKRAYGNKHVHYQLDQEQHSKITNKKWVHYAFPDNIPRNELDNILYRTKFSVGSFAYKKTLSQEDIKDGVSWGEIAKGIEECPIGFKIHNNEIKSQLAKDLQELVDELFSIVAINDERKELRVSVQKRELIDRRTFRENNSIEDKHIKERINSIEGNDIKKGICPHCRRPL